MVIFVCILQGKTKKLKENHKTKVTKIPITKIRKYAMIKALKSIDRDHEIAILICYKNEVSEWAVSPSLSEAILLAATNPQNDKRLFIDLRVQYMETTS